MMDVMQDGARAKECMLMNYNTVPTCDIMHHSLIPEFLQTHLQRSTQASQPLTDGNSLPKSH